MKRTIYLHEAFEIRTHSGIPSTRREQETEHEQLKSCSSRATALCSHSTGQLFECRQKKKEKTKHEHPTPIFGKYLYGRRFEIQNFRNIFCKIFCLPASTRIFEPLKSGVIAQFDGFLVTLKWSPRILVEPFSWLKFSKR